MSPPTIPPISEAVFLLHINVRSLSSNFESFQVRIEQFASPASVIAFTESWLSPNDSAELFNSQGYNFFWRISAIRGCGMFIILKDLNITS